MSFTTIECPTLCKSCPIRQAVNGEPSVMGEIGFEAPGDISPNGRVASFEIHNGVPDNMDKRTSVVGIGNETGLVGFRFVIPGFKLDNESVELAFGECAMPTPMRRGMFGRKKSLGCTALKNLQSK